VVRLSAGRARLSVAEQALCFLAGANSIFSSDTGTMLTKAVPSPDYDADREMLNLLGLRMRPPFRDGPRIGACRTRRDSGFGRARRKFVEWSRRRVTFWACRDPFNVWAGTTAAILARPSTSALSGAMILRR